MIIRTAPAFVTRVRRSRLVRAILPARTRMKGVRLPDVDIYRNIASRRVGKRARLVRLPHNALRISSIEIGKLHKKIDGQCKAFVLCFSDRHLRRDRAILECNLSLLADESDGTFKASGICRCKQLFGIGSSVTRAAHGFRARQRDIKNPVVRPDLSGSSANCLAVRRVNGLDDLSHGSRAFLSA